MDKKHKENGPKLCRGGLDGYLLNHEKDVVCNKPVVAVLAVIGPVCRDHFNGSVVWEQEEDDYCSECNCFKGGDCAGCNCDYIVD